MPSTMAYAISATAAEDVGVEDAQKANVITEA